MGVKCLCERVFSVGFGPGLDSMSPARCRRSGSYVVVVIDLPLLRVAVEGSDNPISLEKPCQASLPPDQQGRHSLGRPSRGPVCCLRYIDVCS